MPYCFWKDHTLQEESLCIFEADPYSIGIMYGISSAGDDINQFTFATETRDTVAQSVPEPRTYNTGVNARDYRKGYGLGGYLSVPVNYVDGWDFSTSAVFNPAVTMSTVVYNAGGVESLTIGYAFSGHRNSTPYGPSTAIDGVVFATETIHSVVDTADAAKLGMASMRSPGKGFFAGGYYTSYVNVIQFFITDSETAGSSSSTLVTARAHAGGTESAAYGCILGGSTGSYIATIETLNFSTESVAAIAAVLNDNRTVNDAAMSSKLKGYCFGGYDGSLKTEIDGIDFATQTAINPTANLSSGTRGATGFTE